MQDLSGALEGYQVFVRSTHTHSRVTFLKGELHRTRKGTLKMAKYLAKMKIVADNLLLARCPISLNDLISQTLAGVDIEYNYIVVQISNKTELSWVELQAALLTHENRVEQRSNLTTSFHLEANIAANGPTKCKTTNNDVTTTNLAWRNQGQNQIGGRNKQRPRQGCQN